MKKPSKRRSGDQPTPKPKPVRPVPPDQRVGVSDVVLVRAKGTPGKGAGPGGEAWSIVTKGVKSGRIFINWIDEPPVGPHASIQIYLNRQSQGRGIGRIAYRLASEDSQYPTIFAHMRKSNEPSKRAAQAAGYRDATPPDYAQHLMRWDRQQSL